MTEVLEPVRLTGADFWQLGTYYALAADARTQVAACWQMATELAQVDPALVGNAERLQLLEALHSLLDALSYLDVEVEGRPAHVLEHDHARRCRSSYHDTATRAQAAAQAAETLLATTPDRSLARPQRERLQRAVARLRRHVEEIGRLIADRHANAA